MTKLGEIDSSTLAYYLPHHGVWNESSTTTKLRVVFDGTAKPKSGLSLNDVQMVGPTIQDDLFSICIRFRKHNIVLVADIEKMYRQVLIEKNQRSLQRIFWRSDPSEPLGCFELNTVTYGTASAAFLAIRCLHQLAYENAAEYPKEAAIILKDFYVDDLITGGETRSEVSKICMNIIKILGLGCFTLRKWASNDMNVIENILSRETKTQLNFGSDSENKILGLIWHSDSDCLKYSIRTDNSQYSITKRSILSNVAQIFDPLGLLAPIIVIAKGIIQQLWQIKLAWDESVPISIYTKWNKLKGQLHLLNELEIHRKVICTNPVLIELHGFSDSSENAYGGCVYMCSRDQFGNYYSNLLCAKSRIAPLKQLTIPRLELCGAFLLAKLTKKVKQVFNLKIDSCYLWTDSTIVLAWIKTSPSQLKTFVANRISQIQTITNVQQWNHIASRDNPADLLSRGIYPREFLKSNLWWYGPSWFKQDIENQPHNDVEDIELSDLPELRKKALIHVNLSVKIVEFVNRFSSFSKLKRVVAYILRFKDNCLKEKSLRILGPLNTSELANANKILIKIAQEKDFHEEVRKLSQNQPLQKRSALIALNPFLDADGIIRVGGRLKHSEFHFDKRHPAVLPAKHHITILIIKLEHRQLLHAGPQAVLASLREKYWPIRGRNLVRKIIRECVECFKAKPNSSPYLMGELPPARLTPSRPFYNCGVDYAGPVFLRDRKTRGYKTLKAYICLFVCFTTRAIHLELVGDLTTDSFIGAFRRFVSRRGKCLNIYSDNGKNFVGAKAELSKFLSKNQDSIIDESTQHNINWHFIPPNSPHFGGIWEAGVKSVKYHLCRIVKNALLTYEQFYTYLTQIEACLNSRPLHPLSNDPNDLSPLTPAHFIIGDALTSLPDSTFVSTPSNRLSHFQLVQKLIQHFWARWAKEYISELQNRVKWRQNLPSCLQPGALVVVKEENLPPLKWKLGRIIAAHPGSDGIIRVATLKMEDGIYKRPVTKLCALPLPRAVPVQS